MLCDSFSFWNCTKLVFMSQNCQIYKLNSFTLEDNKEIYG